MNRRLLAALGAILILLVGVPTIASAATRASSTSTIGAAAPAVPVADSSVCTEQTARVTAAKQAINDKWGVAAARAQQLGASPADVSAAKAILLSSDPPEKRQAELVTLYQNSSLKNLSLADLQKVYDVVDARTTYDNALADAARLCPSLYGPAASATAAPPSSIPPVTADPNSVASDTPAHVAPQKKSGQVGVVPNRAPETGDGSLAA